MLGGLFSLMWPSSHVSQGEDPDEDEIFALVSSLKKVSCFYACHNLSSWGIWASLFEVVREAVTDQRTLPDEAIKHCVACCYCGLLWDLKALQDKIGQGAPYQEDLDALRDRLHMFVDLCKEIVIASKDQIFKEEVRESTLFFTRRCFILK